MPRLGAATRLTVYLHADARRRRRSVADEIIRLAQENGLAGASRFEGFLGYGRLGILHSDIDPDTSGDLPCAVEIIDTSEERLRSFASRIEEILDHGLVVLETTEIVSVFSASAAEGSEA